jgi:hypothetical protein
MEHKENNRNLRKSLLIEKGSHILSNTQNISQELRLTKKLREIRPTRPRTPITKVNSYPKANLKKRKLKKSLSEGEGKEAQGKIRPNHKEAKKAKRSEMNNTEEEKRKEGKDKIKNKIKKTSKPFTTGGNSKPTKAIDLKGLFDTLPEDKRIEFICTYVKPTLDQQKQKKILETITPPPETIDLNDLC